jgi:tripartite-type tricarboxylate transporter receptor subunit TctC
LFAPAGTPADIVDKLNRLLNEVLTSPEVVGRFESHGAQVEPGTPHALASKVRTELARWSEVVVQGGLAPHESRLVPSD